MENNQLAVRDNNLFIAPVVNVQGALQRYQDMKDFVSGILKENVDYGKIPGTSKETLLKPGAEKLSAFFGLSAEFQIIETVEDWTGENHGGEPFFNYWYKCRVTRNGKIIAEGEGSCNSFEKKYRYRSAAIKCPACGNEAVIKGKAQYGGGWLCWSKNGGCGAKFKDGDKSIEDQPRGQIKNPDIADIVNTLQKMAQKRAYIAAVLLATNASEYFTQDIEDFIDADFVAVEPEKKQPAKKQPAPAPEQQTEPEPDWMQKPDLVNAAVEMGGTVKNSLTLETDESHDWESMTTGELAGRLNEYTKRLKTNPKDEDTLNTFNEAKFWLEKKNEK